MKNSFIFGIISVREMCAPAGFFSNKIKTFLAYILAQSWCDDDYDYDDANCDRAYLYYICGTHQFDVVYAKLPYSHYDEYCRSLH